MTEPRRSPEELIAQIREEEARAGRGRLKIFFGANPGVGKTFAMLEEAGARRLEGIDVVVGIVETHGRADTAALLSGLDVIPRRELSYRGVTVQEFDLDRALARKPALTLMDELAHSNAPGSRHEKRWQDVEELLAAGISVYTTLNVQHLESLNDVVAQITGVQVRETVPDSVFDAADEVELADLTPDDLLLRLRQGKVYVAEQAERARERFFRKGNLIALREIALRRVAERVDAQMRGYMREHSIRETWPAGERLLVCVGANPESARLVRAGRRIAGRLRSEWVALHVETMGATPLSGENRAALVENLQLADEFGARTVTLQGHDVAEELLAYARAHNVTRIVIGKPGRRPIRDRFGGSLVDRLVRGSGDIDVYVITGEVGGGPRKRPPMRAPRSPLHEYGLALLMVVIATALGWFIFRRLSLTDVAMVYLLGAIVVASRWGRGPSTIAALLSIALFDFLFIQPLFTFAVADLRYVLTFVMMLFTALMISGFTIRIREQAEIARDRERRTAALYALSRDLADSRTRADIVAIARRHLGDTFSCAMQLLAPSAEGSLEVLAPMAPAPAIDEKEMSVADWVFRRGELAGAGTTTLPGATALHLPLAGGGGVVGVLVVGVAEGSRFELPAERYLLETFAGQVAVALERVTLAESTQQARLEVEAERLRTALLSSLSHDLRTPLGVITGAASSLLERQNQMTPEARSGLLRSILEESERMNRLIRNLLDMIRLETGSLEVQKEWQPLEDTVGVALLRLDERMKDHPVQVHLPPDLPLVPLDAVLLEQVFINLLENTARYSPAGSPVDVSARAIPGAVQVSVADRGTGLLPGEETRIFEKFYRGGDAEPGKGVGLGLTICRGIITAHGGRIWAEARSGGGTIIHFTIPLTGPAPPPIPEEAEVA